MTLRQLEERLATVEKELASLRKALANSVKATDARSMFDFFDRHPGMHVVFEEAMKLREKDRAKVRRQKPAARRVPS